MGGSRKKLVGSLVGGEETDPGVKKDWQAGKQGCGSLGGGGGGGVAAGCCRLLAGSRCRREEVVGAKFPSLPPSIVNAE